MQFRLRVSLFLDVSVDGKFGVLSLSLFLPPPSFLPPGVSIQDANEFLASRRDAARGNGGLFDLRRIASQTSFGQPSSFFPQIASTNQFIPFFRGLGTWDPLQDTPLCASPLLGPYYYSLERPSFSPPSFPRKGLEGYFSHYPPPEGTFFVFSFS